MKPAGRERGRKGMGEGKYPPAKPGALGCVLAYYLCVPSYCGYEVSPRPEVLAYKISLLLSVYTRQVDRTLSLDKSDHLRHCVLRWDRDQHMHVIRQKMTFLDPTFCNCSGLVCVRVKQSCAAD